MVLFAFMFFAGFKLGERNILLNYIPEMEMSLYSRLAINNALLKKLDSKDYESAHRFININFCSDIASFPNVWAISSNSERKLQLLSLLIEIDKHRNENMENYKKYLENGPSKIESCVNTTNMLNEIMR